MVTFEFRSLCEQQHAFKETFVKFVKFVGYQGLLLTRL